MLGGDGRKAESSNAFGESQVFWVRSRRRKRGSWGREKRAGGSPRAEGGRRDKTDRREATARLGKPASERERCGGGSLSNEHPPGEPAGAGAGR